ncbi:MAG TPA: nucleotidyltransferase family protein [Acidimicrobiales bacterium]|jgi:hypothetical protein|nr:nucleotidyltransferase family protein [Acidimicrobiales bacterium]
MTSASDVAHRLRLASETVRALEVFDQCGVDAILMKGPVIERWLYPAGQRRPYSDIDLLVGPDAFERARRALGDAGWVQRHPGARRSEVAPHAIELFRAGAVVDLHDRVPGVAVSPSAAWSLWKTAVVPIELAGRELSAFGPEAVLVVVAVNAARDGHPSLDLAMSLKLDVDVWMRAFRLGSALGAAGVMSAGLNLAPGGGEFLSRIGLEAPSPAGELLIAETPLVAGVARLFEPASMWERARVLAREIVPTPDGLRYWRPGRTTTRRGMAAMYAYRPIYLLWHGPRAVATVWSTRRASGTSRAESGRGSLNR